MDMVDFAIVTIAIYLNIHIEQQLYMSFHPMDMEDFAIVTIVIYVYVHTEQQLCMF
jgi:hypothetical protein